MPPKTNSKAAAGRARKEEQANSKKAAEQAKKDAVEDQKWEQGAKGRSKADEKAEKAAAAAAKKAELQRLKREEEASLPEAKSKAPKAGGAAAKKAAPAPAPAPAPGGLDDALSSFSAANIDDAIAAMSIATESSAKDKVGAKAGSIDAHPERRFKAAFEAYKEAEMPRIRQERPGLRKQQYENELFDEFKKSPLNPFNQLTVDYNASKEERVAALQKDKEATARRLADRS